MPVCVAIDIICTIDMKFSAAYCKRFTSHMSHGACPISLFFYFYYFYKGVGLVGGGSDIDGSYLV